MGASRNALTESIRGERRRETKQFIWHTIRIRGTLKYDRMRSQALATRHCRPENRTMQKASQCESAISAECVEASETGKNEEGVGAWAKPERSGKRDE